MKWDKFWKAVGVIAVIAVIFLLWQNRSDKAYEVKSDTNSKAYDIGEGLDEIIEMCESAYESDYYSMQETLSEISYKCEKLKEIAGVIEDRYADYPDSEPARIPSF